MREVTIILALTVCLAAGVAQGATPRPTSGERDSGGNVDVSGKPYAANVSVGGQDVPLREALERIIPANYSINLPNAGAWAETPVSWHPRQSFVAALREALSGLPDVSAHIDAGLQLVTIRSRTLPFGAASRQAGVPPMASAAAQKVGTASAEPLPAAAQPASQAVAAPAVKPVAPAAPASVPAAPAVLGSGPVSSTAESFPVSASETARTWRLAVADGTVKTALTRWAKDAGWQLVWEVPVDFGIDADATVTGTFQDALETVVRALDKGDTPIQAIFYKGNKVLRIVARGASS